MIDTCLCFLQNRNLVPSTKQDPNLVFIIIFQSLSSALNIAFIDKMYLVQVFNVFSWTWETDKLPWEHAIFLNVRENHNPATKSCTSYCHILPLDRKSSSLSYRCHLWNDTPNCIWGYPTKMHSFVERLFVGWFRPLLPPHHHCPNMWLEF